jgi:hypothetical protein
MLCHCLAYMVPEENQHFPYHNAFPRSAAENHTLGAHLFWCLDASVQSEGPGVLNEFLGSLIKQNSPRFPDMKERFIVLC